MPDQQLINILIAIVGAIGGWILKVTHEHLRDLENEDKRITDKIAKIESFIVGNYITKQEFSQMAVSLMAKLDRIEDKLGQKVDK